MNTILEEYIKIGIIQIKLNPHYTWVDNYGNVTSRMNSMSERIARNQIRKGFKDLHDMSDTPQIVLLPEYSIPHGVRKFIKKCALSLNTVTIGGMDLFVSGSSVTNKGLIVMPNNWLTPRMALASHDYLFGKKYFSEIELKWFNDIRKEGIPDENHYLFDLGPYGVMGVAICSDFYDIERFIIYRGRIHHLVIIAYNKDRRSFDALAHAISRLLFCNVIICNSGFYGGSLAYSPYHKDYKRTVYQNIGSNLFSTQIIKLPVKDLDEEQQLANEQFQQNIINNNSREFKWPPGYRKHEASPF